MKNKREMVSAIAVKEHIELVEKCKELECKSLNYMKTAFDICSSNIQINKKELSMKGKKAKRISAQEKIEKLHTIVSSLPCTPNSFVYVKLYQIANELIGMKKYRLASEICECVFKDIE